MEQQVRAEQEGEERKDSALGGYAGASSRNQILSDDSKQTPQPQKLLQQDRLKHMFGQEEESVQSIQWPSKVADRTPEANKGNQSVAEQIFSASALVKNAVSSVNQAVRNTDDQHRDYQRPHDRAQPGQKGSEQGKVPGQRQQHP